MKQKAILRTSGTANEDIVSILLDQDELTWQNIIYELVNTEQMDPWDIDVSKLAERFFDIIKTLKKMDFRITGKLVLAAALLLKIKSNQLMEEDLTALDALIQGGEAAVDLLEELPLEYPADEELVKEDKPSLIPRTPQPRKRKVSVDELVVALEKALKVEVRRTSQVQEELPEVNIDNIDISKVIQEVYQKVHSHHQKSKEKLTFTRLLPAEADKEDKVYTFIPLLHLDHQRNIDLIQKESFGEITIDFLKELDPDFVIPEGEMGA